VSNVTFAAARDALNAQITTVAILVQPHMAGRPSFQHPNQGGGGPPFSAGQGGFLPPEQGQSQDLGAFVPPPDVAAQSAVQVRSFKGTVLYRSTDLQAAKVTLPLNASARQHLRAGSVSQTVVPVAKERLLVGSTLVSSHGAPTGILQVARSLHDVDGTLTTLWQILLVGGLVATLLAFAAGWWLAGTAVRPINRITHTAQEIGNTQDFSRRVAHSGPPDEVGRLAATFNTMLARLQAAYQTQHRFVADASHELRTPLTSIRGNLGLLQREPPIDEGDRLAVIADLVSESERLSRLVADLLTLARTDTGRPLRHDPVPLAPLVTDMVRRLAVSYPGRQILEDGHGDEVVLGDEDAITQLLLILLDNALKFTPASGTVALTTTMYASRVAIAIRDTGPGISPESLPHVFERFYQSDAMRTGVGTGLGLAIARALVEGLHGTIDGESRLGEGSTFIVTLARSQDAGRAGENRHDTAFTDYGRVPAGAREPRSWRI
jgi:two-component system OmpR family sensor kinase